MEQKNTSVVKWLDKKKSTLTVLPSDICSHMKNVTY